MKCMICGISRETGAEVTRNANVRGRSIVRPYVAGLTWTLVFIVLYAAIRYRKVGVLKASGIVLGFVFIMQGLHLSVLAIIRVPVSPLTMPIALAVFIGSAVLSIMVLEKLKERA